MRDETGAPRLTPGLSGEQCIVVSSVETAAAAGNDADLTVLSTPHLLMLIEAACHKAVRPLLAEGQRVVGVAVTLKHLAATPIGERVTARATLTEVDGPRLIFDVVADDEHERVGEARMECFTIDLARFCKRLERKSGQR